MQPSVQENKPTKSTVSTIWKFDKPTRVHHQLLGGPVSSSLGEMLLLCKHHHLNLASLLSFSHHIHLASLDRAV